MSGIFVGNMSDQKNHQFRPALYNGDPNRTGKPSGSTRMPSSASTGDPRISEKQGWEAYRKWLSRDNAQPAQRTPLDASIYSWRGYNNWADKVRQTWKADEPVDS